MLLSRLLNMSQDTIVSPPYSLKPNSSLEAITYANSYCRYLGLSELSPCASLRLDNQLMQIITQAQSEVTRTVDIQSIAAVLTQLGEQLTLALVRANETHALPNCSLLETIQSRLH